MSRPVRWLVFSLAVAVLAGAGTLFWHLRLRSTTFLTDNDTIRRAVAETSPRDVLWRGPVKLPAGINTDGDEYEPALAPEGAVLFFVRGKAGHNADIYYTTKQASGFSEPRPLAAINTEADELGPQPSPDGQALYFCSNRAGGVGHYDLWVARRGPRGWEPPVNLGPAVNSRYNDHGPSLSPDGSTLYFASNRPRPDDTHRPAADAWSAAVADDLAKRDYDIYMVAIGSDRDGRAEAAPGLNGPHNEIGPAVSPVGDFIYFSSDRPGGAGGFDLYRSRLLAGSEPSSLGPAVNTPGNELDPAVSLGGFGVHLSSDRAAVGVDGAIAGGYDIYYTTSREVFRQTETDRASFEIAALWAWLWPYLVGLLASILLLYFLLKWLERLEYRRLSLLVNCMIVSLAVHLLLLVGFAFWAVTAATASWTRPGGALQVALVSTAADTALARQIRGQLTSIDLTALAPASTPIGYRPDVERDRPEPSADIVVDRTALTEPQEPAKTIRPREAPAEFKPLAAAIETLEPQPDFMVDIPRETDPRTRTEPSVTLELQGHIKSETHTQFVATPPGPVLDERPLRVAPGEVHSDRAQQTMARHTVAEADLTTPPPLLDTGSPVSEGFAGAGDLALPELPEYHRTGFANRARDGFLRPQPARAAKATDLSVPDPQLDAGPPLLLTPAVAVSERAQQTMAERAVAEAPPSAPSSDDRTRSLESLGGPPVVVLSPLPEVRRSDRVQLPQVLQGHASPVAPAEVVTAGAAFARTMRLGPDEADRDPPAASLVLPFPRQVKVSEVPVPVIVIMVEAGRLHLDLQVPAEVVTADVGEIAGNPVDVALGSRRAGWASRVPEPKRRPLDRPGPQAPALPPEAIQIIHMPAQIDVDDSLAGRLALVEALSSTALSDLDLDLDLQVPTRTVPNPYAQRAPEKRKEILQKLGGSRETEQAVALSLDWLARHQSADGRWDGTNFDSSCGECGGVQQATSDIALTGLALLCFLGADHTHLGDGPYRDVVGRGLDWLLSRQNRRGGLLGDQESMYSHGIAVIALAEAYGLTGDQRLFDPVKKGVEFIYASRNRDAGGWRYLPGQYGDTSVLGWLMMAVVSAQRANVDVPDGAFDVARRWLGLVSKPGRPGQYAYQPARRASPAMTAEGMFVWQLLGARRTQRRMAGSAEYLVRHLPKWRTGANTYYWYYATMALFQHQGPEWVKWNEAVKVELLANQVTRGKAAGSWETKDRWSQYAGRIYQTALCTLTLEVYYRYLPSFVREP